MSSSQKIAWIIRTCRLSRGYSQDYMADKLQMCQSSYANLESGKNVMTVDRLVRIAEVLNLDIHELIDTGLHIPAPDAHEHSPIVLPDVKVVYDQLVLELRSEILFLRTMLKEKS